MREKKAINIEIGERVKAAREQADITQEQLAERIDVSTQYVSDLERGVVGISVPTLKNLCVALGIASDRILSVKRRAAVCRRLQTSAGSSVRHSRPCSPTLLTASYRQSFQSVKSRNRNRISDCQKSILPVCLKI